MKRASGVLMHISSLPGEYGIGSLGVKAREFADFLKSCGFSYWQILPVNEPDDCNSPYKSPSAFAGNPLFIDLEGLCRDGLLEPEELSPLRLNNPHLCEFGVLRKTRIPILYKAYTRIDSGVRTEIRRFREANPWASQYAEYMAMRDIHKGEPWQKWRDILPDPQMVEFYSFLQYVFMRQWNDLKDYANSIGIKIIGDMPIYVDLNSADVYFNKKYFQLDENGEPRSEAGVPPDYFAEDGQAWGNPVYDWEALKLDGYSWWIERIRHSLRMFDMVRIDHFRGFASYWSIPRGKKAVEGAWKKGPGAAFFKALKKVIPDASIIAEDLGDIDENVVKLLGATGFPGMRVMQFAFLNAGDKENVHLPYNYLPNTVAYTGTHDNNTLLGWLWDLSQENRSFALDYCGFEGGDWGEGGAKSASVRSVIRTLFRSTAKLAVVPVQDLCGFGGDTRMNIPGNAENNWAFRITDGQLAMVDREWFAELNRLYGRI